jgi:hypothetical protein
MLKEKLEKFPNLFELATKNIRKKQMMIKCEQNDVIDVQAITTINKSINVKKLVLKDCTINSNGIAEYLQTNKTLEELDLTENETDIGILMSLESLNSNTTLTSLKMSIISIEESMMKVMKKVLDTPEEWIKENTEMIKEQITQSIISGFILAVSDINRNRTTKKYFNMTIKTDCNNECFTNFVKEFDILNNLNESEYKVGQIKVSNTAQTQS